MSQDPRIAAMAEVLVQYSLGVQPGWRVCISSSPLAAPLIAAVYRETLAAGGFPTVHLTMPELTDILLAEGNDEQIGYATPFARILWDEFDAIVTSAPSSTRARTPTCRPGASRSTPQAQRRYSKAFPWMRARPALLPAPSSPPPPTPRPPR